MTTYSVCIATYYAETWHLDRSTESAQVSESQAIAIGREWILKGGFPLYLEYRNGVETRTLIEFDSHLVAAFGL